MIENHCNVIPAKAGIRRPVARTRAHSACAQGRLCAGVTTWGLLLATLLCRSIAWGASDEGPQIVFDRQPGAVVIRAGVEPLATYVYEDAEILRPYFKDVFAPGGIRVTRHHPPREGIDRTDHASMHPGLFLAFGDLGGADFWRNKAKVEHVEFTVPPSVGKGRGSFTVRNRYLAEQKTVCEETCEYTFAVQPEGYLILWDSTFQAMHSSFSFGDQEEMGLGVRVATSIAVTTQSGGRLLDSDGRKGEKDIWGRAAAWCDYSGWVGDRFAGIAVMPNPANFRPCWWHVRDYGLMVANPFGRRALAKGEPSQVIVQPGEPFRLRYAILLHSSPTEGGIDIQKACRMPQE
jgi:hypothetical protein